MNIIRALIATFAAVCLVLIGAVPAQAAKPVESGVVFTISASTSDPRIDIYEVARDWSKNTDITVNVGECSGDLYWCIHLVAEVAPGGGYDGYASRRDDGSCNAAVREYWVQDGGPELYIAKHETGHCLGIGHLSNEKALMYPYFEVGVREQQSNLTPWDRQAAQDRW